MKDYLPVVSPSCAAKAAAPMLLAALFMLGGWTAIMPANADPAILPPAETRAEMAHKFHDEPAKEIFCSGADKFGLGPPLVWERNRQPVGVLRIVHKGDSSGNRKRCDDASSFTFVSKVKFATSKLKPPRGHNLAKATLSFRAENDPRSLALDMGSNCRDAIEIAVLPIAPWKPVKTEVDRHATAYPNRGLKEVRGIADERAAIDVTGWARRWASRKMQNTGIAFYPATLSLERGNEACVTALSNIELRVEFQPTG